MTDVMKRETKPDVFDRLDRLFDDWMESLPFRRRALFGRDWHTEDMIRVDEFRDGGDVVIRAELPGVDPDKDVTLTVSDGMLHLEAERREEKDIKEKGYTRHELRTGSFMRTLPLPAGASEADVKATYRDGMLEVRVPAPEPEPTAETPPEVVRKIEISKG